MLLRTEFVNFLKNPSEVPISSDPLYLKAKKIFQLYCIGLVIVIIGAIVQKIVVNSIGYNHIYDLSKPLMAQSNIWIILVRACLIAPLIEEAAFRLFLEPNKFNLSFGLAMLFNIWSWIFINLILYQQIFIVIILSSVLYFLFSYYKKSYRTLLSFIRSKYGLIFYVITLLFAIIHVWNYEVSKVWLIAPLLVVPQFTWGIILGVTRIKYSIFSAILMHALINLNVWFFAVFVSNNGVGNMMLRQMIQNDQRLEMIESLVIGAFTGVILYNVSWFFLEEEK